jgi:hypothetical protein
MDKVLHDATGKHSSSATALTPCMQTQASGQFIHGLDSKPQERVVNLKNW